MLKKSRPELNEDEITAFLKEAVQNVKTEEDPDILNEYRKLFRKNVPFTLRSYVAAYFIKEMEGSIFSKGRSFGRRSIGKYAGRGRNTSERYVPDHPVLDASEAASIFISVGRSRRVFPRDIITLLIQNADITRERIGDIRILENYSFVQVMSADADSIIEKLNNFSYRGRPLSVSYSRKIDDEELVDGEGGGSEESAAAIE